VTRRTRRSGSSRFEMRTNSVHPAAWRAPATRADPDGHVWEIAYNPD
jgi:predicted lactoylglutathione lyase